MAHARMQQQRRLIVAQASLVWDLANEESTSDLDEFIRCGDFGGDNDVMPYDPNVRDQIFTNWKKDSE